MNRIWIIGGIIVVILIAAGAWLISMQKASAPTAIIPATGTATTTGSAQFVPTSTEQLSVASVSATIVGGTWSSKSPAVTVSFAQGGSVTGALSALAPMTGSWQLYTAADAPSDLSGLSLDPDGVFLRLTFGSKHEDFFVNAAATSTLAIGPLGQPGLITLTR